MTDLALGTLHPHGGLITAKPSRAQAIPEQANGARITLRAVTKRFGAATVLDGIDLSIEPGEFVAIVGHSGCGKSTLLRLIAGLDQPSAGGITLDHSAITGPSAAIRIMFQEARLLPWRRVLANVGIGGRGEAWAAAAAAALARVGLADKANAWPATLSGGQRQRVALARALISRPRLLLLDEPLGALDALTRLDMQALIAEVWRAHGFTAVLVTHDVAEAVSLADRVIVLDHGRIGATWSVPLPRPRPRAGAERGAIEDQILAWLLDREQRSAPGRPSPDL